MMEVVKGKYENPEGKGGTKLPRIDFPLFDRENPREWVRRANKYFQIHGVEEELKFDITQLYFKDKVDI